VKVAAYQAPLLPTDSNDALGLLREAVKSCEAQNVDILCCPEAILGGLADYAADPGAYALETGGEQLASALTPLASTSVTTIVGFTERTASGALYNTAAVLHQGSVLGLYRKLHPAINRSIYLAGDEMPVFQVGDLTFGIMICNDSNYPEPARVMAASGAKVLFVPTNNGLPANKTYPELVAQTRRVDTTCAIEHRVWVVRADVAGRAAGLVSDGASGIVDPEGVLIAAARCQAEDLLIADIDTSCRRVTMTQESRT
jgi:predicted amidohydrolase